MRKNQLLPSFSILLLLLLLAFLISLSVGYANSSFSELLDLIRGRADSSTLLIIGRIRLPRIVASMIGGASLSLAGLLLQTLTRNPLADSGILGINTGAGLVVAILVGLSSSIPPVFLAFTPSLPCWGEA